MLETHFLQVHVSLNCQVLMVAEKPSIVAALMEVPERVRVLSPCLSPCCFSVRFLQAMQHA